MRFGVMRGGLPVGGHPAPLFVHAGTIGPGGVLTARRGWCYLAGALIFREQYASFSCRMCAIDSARCVEGGRGGLV